MLFVGTSIIHPSTEGVFLLCNILDLLIYSYNTIILKHGVGSYSKKQFNNFTEGDCICGENASPEELKRWTGDQYDLAKAELAKYSCSYRKSGGYMFADEYALEYCNTDEDGEFLDGSDLDLAEKEA